MLGGQDWCLECGTAAPGRLGARPGWRAVATTLALTLVLVGGAVAASYAALSSESTREVSAAAPPDGTPVAQVPAAVPAPPAPVVAPAPVVPPVAAPAGAVPLPTAPKVTPLPKVPVVTPPAIRSPVAPSTATAPKPSTSSTRPSAPAVLAPVPLGADAGSLYDPYARVTEQGDAADAYDGDAKTTWNVTAKADGSPMGLGYLVDLGAAKTVRAVELATATPGFRVEVYATDSSALPPDILDTRWAQVGARSKVDQGTQGSNKAGDGKERIVLEKGTGDARYVLLWLTTPPAEGPSVGLTQLDLLA